VNHVPFELVAADQGARADEAASGVFYGRKRLGENLVEGFAGFQTGAKLVGFGAQLVVGELLVGLLKLVDAGDNRTGLFEELLVMTTGKTLEEKGEHEG
jgi:hypothetical protein